MGTKHYSWTFLCKSWFFCWQGCYNFLRVTIIIHFDHIFSKNCKCLIIWEYTFCVQRHLVSSSINTNCFTDISLLCMYRGLKCACVSDKKSGSAGYSKFEVRTSGVCIFDLFRSRPKIWTMAANAECLQSTCIALIVCFDMENSDSFSDCRGVWKM